MNAVFDCVARAVFAHVHAGEATDTPTGVGLNFRFRRKGFRVVTPCAAELATLQKDDGANPGTVVQGEPLDMRDEAGRHFNAASRLLALFLILSILTE